MAGFCRFGVPIIINMTTTTKTRPETIAVMHLCGGCAVAIGNDDYSGHDFHCDCPGDEPCGELASISQASELIGHGAITGPHNDHGGNWRCWSCGNDQIGENYRGEVLGR